MTRPPLLYKLRLLRVDKAKFRQSLYEGFRELRRRFMCRLHMTVSPARPEGGH